MKPKNFFTNKPLWFSGVLLFFMSFSLGDTFSDTSGSFYDATIRINPVYKILRLSNGDVIVSSKNQEGSEIKQRFTDFYADLLLAAYHKQRLDRIVENLGKKYYLSEDECRRETKHAINVLTDWKIIFREDQIALH